MKRIFQIIMVLSMLFSSSGIIAAEQMITISIDGTEHQFDQATVQKDGHILLPLRGIFEQAGAQVEWDGNKRTATVKMNDMHIVVKIGSKQAEKNGVSLTMPVEAQIINGTTMIPLPFIGQAFDGYTKWDHDAQIAYIFSSKESLLMSLAEHDDAEQITKLLAEGANPDGKGNNGWTPLMTAVFYNNTGSVKALLTGGADPNFVTEDGDTPLTWAARYGSTEIANELLQAGANPDGKNHLKWTALMYAAYTGNFEIAASLLKAGADTKIKNNEGETAADIAEHREHSELLDLLRQK
ncbi:stalk domain-containing protein [Ferviditalea candida]|uniref:Ankyrin repeat domain-containing protein n=1 Tax=Ferviditalea candida TaxID=3108399 RepID=A0ABU5ZES8_9BACL|nr:ankyrin repeat domain-containing protein [Paenibacillaceae bacterium T2]